MNVESGFQAADLLGIVRRRGKPAVVAAGIITLAAYWLAMALPNEYESFATVLVEPQSVSPDLLAAGIAKSDLNERLYLMTAQILSRPRLSRIIDEMGLYQKESRDMLREDVVDLMRSSVRVEPVIPELAQGEMFTGRAYQANLEINRFKIIFRDDDAAVAKEVAQRLANEFIEEHIEERVTVSQKSLEFIAAELERIAARMKEIEVAVAKVKAENSGRLPEDLHANQSRLSRILTELASAQRSADEARSNESFWRSQTLTAGALARASDEANPLRRIQMLELMLAEYQARGFTEKHPDVVTAKLELEAIRASVAAQGEEERDDETTQDFTQQTAEAERRRAELRMQAAEQAIQRLTTEADEVRALIAETPGVAEQLDGLRREYESQLNSYRTYIARQQEASAQAGMERRQLGEQFRVLEAAFEATAPASPNRVLIILLGLVLGAVVGAGIGILLETADPSAHNVRQLQSALRIPVLAAIPQIWLESDRAAQRRRRIRTALATAGMVAFALVGGAANYVWVNGVPGFLSTGGEGEVRAAAEATGAEAPGEGN